MEGGFPPSSPGSFRPAPSFRSTMRNINSTRQRAQPTLGRNATITNKSGFRNNFEGSWVGSPVPAQKANGSTSTDPFRSSQVNLTGMRSPLIPESPGLTWQSNTQQQRTQSRTVRRSHTARTAAPGHPAIPEWRHREMGMTSPAHPDLQGGLMIQSDSESNAEPEPQNEEMKLKKALGQLTDDRVDVQASAAKVVQQMCFDDERWRSVVCSQAGLMKLLQLLKSCHTEVRRASAGALRNIAFQNLHVQNEMKEPDNWSIIMEALKKTSDAETGRQLTGLLWSVSSDEKVKEKFDEGDIAALTDLVVEPHASTLKENENPTGLADADVFYNTTGCLRNLSSGGPNIRKKMRDCDDLIESLVCYIEECKTYNKAVGHCLSILHNLTYQAVGGFPITNPDTHSSSSQHGNKKTEEESKEDRGKRNVKERSYESKIIRMSLSLIRSDNSDAVKKNAVGLLQNMTAGIGKEVEDVGFILVGEKNFPELFKFSEVNRGTVEEMLILLIKNLSRYTKLHPRLVGDVLEKLVALLPCNDMGTDQPSEVTASLCDILINLSRGSKESAKAVVDHDALVKITQISRIDNWKGPSRAGCAAATLLLTIWAHRGLRSHIKTFGFTEKHFINRRTAKLSQLPEQDMRTDS